MEQIRRVSLLLTVLILESTAHLADAAGPPIGPLTRCAPDAVIVGAVCIDKYEASVWEVPRTNKAGRANIGLIKKIRYGTATLSDLVAGDATHLGLVRDGDYPCAYDGQDCKDKIFAVSIAGVLPSANVTWFQAQQACLNSRKRLPSNAEWQGAVAGTPDPGLDNGTTDCNTGNPTIEYLTRNTGSRSRCVSVWGAYDMVGNLSEIVADWQPCASTCKNYPDSNDINCMAGATTDSGPCMLVRGGDFGLEMTAGPLAGDRSFVVLQTLDSIGFRCAR